MKTLDVNLFQLIIILGAFQALIFSTIIFIGGKYRTKANTFLGLTVFFTALSIIQHMLIDTNVWPPNYALRKLYIPIQWLILPMLYIHIKEFLFKNSMKSRTTLFLLIPFFAISLLHLLHFLYASSTTKIALLPDYNENSLLLYTNIISFAFNSIVIYLIFKTINAYIKGPKSTSKPIRKKIYIYKKIIVLAIICVSVGLISLSLMILMGVYYSFMIYPFHIILSGSIYWIGYVGVTKNEFGRAAYQKEQNIKSIGLSMFNKVSYFIIHEEQYLDPDLNLERIAKNFGITTGYLSKIINQHTNKHFSNYINQQRVEAAKKKIKNPQFSHYTIESIGLESGFRSKSNFYTAFKKFTGFTPNQYRKRK